MNHVHENSLVKVKRRMQAAPKEDNNTAKTKVAYEDAMPVDILKIETFGASQSEKMIMLREWFCSYMQGNIRTSTNTKTEEENSKYVCYKDKVLD